MKKSQLDYLTNRFNCSENSVEEIANNMYRVQYLGMFYLLSYDTIVGLELGNKTLFTVETSSVTTTRHLSKFKQAEALGKIHNVPEIQLATFCAALAKGTINELRNDNGWLI